MFNITSKYFSFFNNKLPASWVAHITRSFTCYSYSYYSSMLQVITSSVINQLSTCGFWSKFVKFRKIYSLSERIFIFYFKLMGYLFKEKIMTSKFSHALTIVKRFVTQVQKIPKNHMLQICFVLKLPDQGIVRVFVIKY